LNVHSTRVAATRAASFKSLYRTRAGAPCSQHHPSVDARIRYSPKTWLPGTYSLALHVPVPRTSQTWYSSPQSVSILVKHGTPSPRQCTILV